MPWILAVAKPSQEGLAEYNLRCQGYAPYCPRYLHKQPPKAAVIRPLFPRYIFIPIVSQWYSVRGTRGISYVLMSEGERPQTVPDREVMRFINRHDHQGLVRLEGVQSRFVRGQRVTVDSGPLLGHELFYEGLKGHERVELLIDMLGRKVRIEAAEADLRAA